MSESAVISTNEIIDTNSEKGRVLRGVSQYKYEQENIRNLNGKDFLDRYFEIRKGVFDRFDNGGERELNIRRDVVGDRFEASDVPYPYLYLSSELAEPYANRVDELYSEVENINDIKKKEEATFRFLSFVNIIGISLHFREDGNGQTMKLITTSYLHDLLPDKYGDCWVPIKYSADGWTPKDEIHPKFLGGGFISELNDASATRVPGIEPKNEKEKQLIDSVREAYKISMIISDEKRATLTNKIQKIATGMSKLIGEPMLGKLHYNFFKKKWRKKEPYPYSAYLSFANNVFDYLVQSGYPRWMTKASVFGQHMLGRRDATSYFVSEVLSENGREEIRNYVIENKLKFKEDVFEKMLRIFENQRKNFDGKFESSEKHREKYEKARKEV